MRICSFILCDDEFRTLRIEIADDQLTVWLFERRGPVCACDETRGPAPYEGDGTHG